MPDLSTQLRTYFDAIDPPFDLDEVLSAGPTVEAVQRLTEPAAEPSRPRSWWPRRRPGWAVALAALVVTLVVLGGGLLLTRGGGGDVADEPATTGPTPTTSPAPTTEPTATTTALETIPPSGYAVIPIDTEGIVGKGPAIALGPNGNPVVAYLGHNDVKLAVCSDPACTSFAPIATVAEGGFPSEEIGPSMAVKADGNPVAAYGFSTESREGFPDLYVTVCDDPGCSSWTTTVIAEGELALRAAVAIGDDGRPIVAYVDGNSNLRIAVCEDATCSSASITTVDGGQWASAVNAVPGSPPSFLYRLSEGLQLATCGDGGCGDVTTTPISGIGVGQTVAIEGGQRVARSPEGIVIASVARLGEEPQEDYQPAPGEITVTTCRDPSCEDGTSAVIAAVEVSDEASIVALATDPAGNPVVAYHEYGQGLRVAHCSDPLCLDEPAIGSLAISGQTAMAIGSDGNPLLAIFTGSDAALVRCGDPACADVPPPPPPPPALGFDGPGWTTTVAADGALDWNRPWVAFRSDGLPNLFFDTLIGDPAPENEERGTTMVRCADAACSQVEDGRLLDADLGWGGRSFAVDGEGLPVTAFWSWGERPMLGFARCDDPTCATVSRRELYEADSWPPPDLAVDSRGLPVMVFQNYTFNPGPVQVARCVDAACSSVEVADTDFDCVDETCEWFWSHNTVTFALTPDDRPVAAYASSSGRIRLVVCEDPACTSFTAQTLDATGGDSEAARVAIGPDGNPVIGYYADGTAKLAFCLDAYCAEIHVAEIGPAARNLWSAPYVATLGDGRVAMAYASGTDQIPRLAACSYPCSEPMVRQLSDVTGVYALASSPEGLPLIAFIDLPELDGPPEGPVVGDLVVAACTDLSCLGG